MLYDNGLVKIDFPDGTPEPEMQQAVMMAQQQEAQRATMFQTMGQLGQWASSALQPQQYQPRIDKYTAAAMSPNQFQGEVARQSQQIGQQQQQQFAAQQNQADRQQQSRIEKERQRIQMQSLLQDQKDAQDRMKYQQNMLKMQQAELKLRQDQEAFDRERQVKQDNKPDYRQTPGGGTAALSTDANGVPSFQQVIPDAPEEPKRSIIGDSLVSINRDGTFTTTKIPGLSARGGTAEPVEIGGALWQPLGASGYWQNLGTGETQKSDVLLGTNGMSEQQVWQMKATDWVMKSYDPSNIAGKSIEDLYMDFAKINPPPPPEQGSYAAGLDMSVNYSPSEAIPVESYKSKFKGAPIYDMEGEYEKIPYGAFFLDGTDPSKGYIKKGLAKKGEMVYEDGRLFKVKDSMIKDGIPYYVEDTQTKVTK